MGEEEEAASRLPPLSVAPSASAASSAARSAGEAAAGEERHDEGDGQSSPGSAVAAATAVASRWGSVDDPEEEGGPSGSRENAAGKKRRKPSASESAAGGPAPRAGVMSAADLEILRELDDELEAAGSRPAGGADGRRGILVKSKRARVQRRVWWPDQEDDAQGTEGFVVKSSKQVRNVTCFSPKGFYVLLPLFTLFFTCSLSPSTTSRGWGLPRAIPPCSIFSHLRGSPGAAWSAPPRRQQPRCPPCTRRSSSRRRKRAATPLQSR